MDGETGGKRETGMGTQGVKAGRGWNRQMHALHGQKPSGHTPGHLHSTRALTMR